MKRIMLIVYVISALSSSLVFAADNSESNGDVVIPPGMELIKEGDVGVVVPIGGRIRKQGSVMLIETPDEYAARKFLDANNRFNKIEAELEAQKIELETRKKEIMDLKSAVNELRKDGQKK